MWLVTTSYFRTSEQTTERQHGRLCKLPDCHGRCPAHDNFSDGFPERESVKVHSPNLGCAANAFRHKSCPRNPTDLDFKLQYEHIPAEFQEDGTTKDITVDGRRHILVSMNCQLDVLASARRWFVDGTFKVCLFG